MPAVPRPALQISPPSAYDLVRLFHRTELHWTRPLGEEAAERWNEPQVAEAHMLQLDDPHWDALLALRDGRPVGGVGVLSVGDVGRIDEVFVSEPARRRGIGRTLMSRALEICARSL